MKKRKIVSLLLVGALVAGMTTVTGCGSSDGKSSGKSGKTELELFSTKAENKEVVQQLVDKFNESHEDVTIKITAPADAGTVLKTRMAKNDMPDIVMMGGDNNYTEVESAGMLYQDSKAVPMISLLEKSLGDRTAVLLGERAAADTLILTPRTVSGREMLDAVCMPVGTDPEDVLVLAGGLPMLDMVRASSQSTAAADAPAELRLAAQKVTLTDAAAGSAVEVLYRMVRDAENLA